MQPAKQMYQVVVQGAELVSKKTLAMLLEIATIANSDGHQVKKLILTNQDTIDVGLAQVEEGNIIIGLKNIVDEMLEDYRANEKFLSFQAEYLIQLILIMGHECGHIMKYHDDPTAFRMMGVERREKLADDAGEEALLYLLETFNIEPAAMIEESYLLARLQAAYITDVHTAWVAAERLRAAKGLVFEGKEGSCGTLREFAQKRWKDKGLDWKQATYPVRIEFNPNEKGETKVYQPEYDEPEAEGIFAPVDEDCVVIGAEEVEEGAEGSYASDEDNDNFHEVGEDSYVAPMGAAPVINTAVAPTTMNPKEVPMTQGLVLPPHLAAQRAAGATGAAAVAAGGRPKVDMKSKTYPANKHSQEKMAEFMDKVYERLYAHIFTECGWTGTADVNAADWNFSNPAAVVAKPVNISDLIHAYGMPDVIMEYNTHDAKGFKLYGEAGTAEKCGNGLIRGEIFHTSKLPGYTLWCNFGGACYKRSITPQNLAKTSKYALLARNGHMIAWVMKGEFEDGRKFMGHFEDGAWIPNVVK